MDREFLASTTTKSSMRRGNVLTGSSNKRCTSRIRDWSYTIFSIYKWSPAKLQSKVRLFADDTIVYMVAVTNETDAAILQKDLKLLEEWENRSQMSFHPDKCNVLRVTRCRNPLTHYYILRNQILKEKAAAVKYLGVTVHHKLSWNEHICSMVKKLIHP